MNEGRIPVRVSDALARIQWQRAPLEEGLRERLVDRARREDPGEAHNMEYAEAAFCYLLDYIGGSTGTLSGLWPWTPEEFTATPGDPLGQLAKAAALIVTEMDRLTEEARMR